MNKGVLYGAGAYLFWGFFPIWIKSVQAVPAIQILMHRIVWSFLFLLGVVAFIKGRKQLTSAWKKPRVLGIYTLAALILAGNWLTYIYGVNSGQVVETSLGYFINPLFNVSLGVIFLRERLRPLQWLPVALAAIGVTYLTIQVGGLPWIALALAGTFGLYGLIKKVAPLEAFSGLTLETGLLFLPALGYLLYQESLGVGAFGHMSLTQNVLLSLAGVVTAVPLLMFSTAARLIPFWQVGLLQYIAPTCQFLLGVLLYREPFGNYQVVGFSIIWAALLIFTLEGFYARRQARQTARQETQTIT